MKELSQKIKRKHYILAGILLVSILFTGIAVTEYASSLYRDKQTDKLINLFGFLFWGGGGVLAIMSLMPSISYLLHKFNLFYIKVSPKDISDYGNKKLEWNSKKKCDYIDFRTEQGIVRIKDHEELRNNERFFKTIQKGEHWVGEIRIYNRILDKSDKIDYISVAISEKMKSTDNLPIYIGFRHLITYKDETTELVDNYFFNNYIENYFLDSNIHRAFEYAFLMLLFVFSFFIILRCFLLKGGGHWLALQYFIRLWDSFSSFFSDLLG